MVVYGFAWFDRVSSFGRKCKQSERERERDRERDKESFFLWIHWRY